MAVMTFLYVDLYAHVMLELLNTSHVFNDRCQWF